MAGVKLRAIARCHCERLMRRFRRNGNLTRLPRIISGVTIFNPVPRRVRSALLASQTVIEGLIWPSYLAFGRTPPVGCP